MTLLTSGEYLGVSDTSDSLLIVLKCQPNMKLVTGLLLHLPKQEFPGLCIHPMCFPNTFTVEQALQMEEVSAGQRERLPILLGQSVPKVTQEESIKKQQLESDLGAEEQEEYRLPGRRLASKAG